MKKLVMLLMVMMVILVGCGKTDSAEPPKEGEISYKNDVATEELKGAVVEAMGENYWPNMPLGEAELESFIGISADLYEEFVAEIPMVSVNVDTMIILKAKEGQEAAAEEALNAYKTRLQEDTLQYPMNLGKIQASTVTRLGQYVCFLQLGADTGTASEESEEAVIKQCQAENQKALDAITAVLQE